MSTSTSAAAMAPEMRLIRSITRTARRIRHFRHCYGARTAGNASGRVARALLQLGAIFPRRLPLLDEGALALEHALEPFGIGRRLLVLPFARRLARRLDVGGIDGDELRA